MSGFISVVSWNWAFWIGVIFAGVTWPLFWWFPETYGPAILKQRAQRLRKETGDESLVAPLELEKTDLNHIVTVVLSRPLRMICFEPLVLFTCLYLSYACKLILSPIFRPSSHSMLTNIRCHILHLPPILPHHLHRNLLLQPRRNRPYIPPHRRGRHDLRHHVSVLGLHLTPRPTPESPLGLE